MSFYLGCSTFSIMKIQKLVRKCPFNHLKSVLEFWNKILEGVRSDIMYTQRILGPIYWANWNWEKEVFLSATKEVFPPWVWNFFSLNRKNSRNYLIERRHFYFASYKRNHTKNCQRWWIDAVCSQNDRHSDTHNQIANLISFDLKVASKDEWKKKSQWIKPIWWRKIPWVRTYQHS